MKPSLTSLLRAAVIAVGIVLVVASLLKTHALALNGFGRSPFDAVSRPAIIVIELFLGGMLCFQAPRRRVLAATAALFAAFCVYHLVLSIRGEPSCKCFGVVAHQAWQSFLIDIACLAALLAALRWLPNEASLEAGLLDAGGKRLLAGSLAAGAGCWLLCVLVDSSPNVAELRREAVRFNADSLEIGTVQSGKLIRANVEVANKWSQPVTLIGGAQKCNCDPLFDLPLTLKPGERRTLTVSLASPVAKGYFDVPLTFNTDLAWQPLLRGRLHGMAVPPPPQRSVVP
jgi:hypothetical protein